MSIVTNGHQWKGQCLNFDHLTFWVSNARQAASYYCVHFGFEPFVYRGLETGSRSIASHVIKQGKIILVFSSSLSPSSSSEISDHVSKHGDSVKDVAFSVDDLDLVVKRAVEKGALVIRDIEEEIDPKNGKVRFATVATFGDVTHTFVERQNYSGLFLPGFQPSPLEVKIQTVRFDEFHHHLIFLDKASKRVTSYGFDPY